MEPVTSHLPLLSALLVAILICRLLRRKTFPKAVSSHHSRKDRQGLRILLLGAELLAGCGLLIALIIFGASLEIILPALLLILIIELL